MTDEQLFINTLAINYPQQPVVFYFSNSDYENIPLAPLNHQLFPNNITDIYPDISNSDTIYTSFTTQIDGFQPLPIDFHKPQNYNLVKRYYNREIKYFFTSKGYIVESTFVHDNQVWWKSKDQSNNRIKGSTLFNRYTLKINYNHFNNTPELVLTYDRPATILNKSVSKLLSEYESKNDDIFSDNSPLPSINPADCLNRVLYIQYVGPENIRNPRICKYDHLCRLGTKGKKINYDKVFPIVNPKLSSFLGYDEEEEESVTNKTSANKNRYITYLSKINNFKKVFINSPDFQGIIHTAAEFTPVQAGKTSTNSKNLMFGKNDDGVNVIDVIPQNGINSGPYSQPRHNNIQLFFIVPQSHKDHAVPLYKMLREGYKLFRGLTKYLGVVFTTSRGFSIAFSNNDNPIPEIKEKLETRTFIPNVKYFAIYLTPIGKYSIEKKQRLIYYKVKELLLDWNIPSQCIETQKMLSVLKNDNEHNLGNFAYTLQNIAIASNTKLGGTPWRIAVPEYRELIVGVGAFKHIDTNTQYIGSAFSFDNTGSFNSFEYFHKDELKELAGSIEDAIICYKNAVQNPTRLIIHYYKDMSEREVEVIEKTLININLDIPVFIVTINKTESEDVFVYDFNYSNRMPYSGTYVNLGNSTYLLCNNTRYEGSSRRIEGFPFPVKLKIKCPSDPSLLNQTTINGLIDQVYQFSRIYWKSVKQQNLPVTIKYPEMVAQIAPHFTNGIIPDAIGNDNLWFL